MQSPQSQKMEPLTGVDNKPKGASSPSPSSSSSSSSDEEEDDNEDDEAVVLQKLSQLQDNRRQRARYEELIELTRARGMLEELRATRKAYANEFCLSPLFWRQWLEGVCWN